MALISKKTLILRRLTELLETISYTSYNGDEIDLEGAVSRGRALYGDEAPITFLALVEKPRQILGEGGGEQKTMYNGPWDILVQGFARDDPNHPLDPGYELLAHVEQKMARIIQESPNGMRGGLYPEDYLLGLKELITSFSFIMPIVRPPDNDVSNTAYFFMPVSIGLVTDMASPFTEET